MRFKMLFNNMSVVLTRLFLIISFTAVDLSLGSTGKCALKFPPYLEGYCFRSSACPGAVIRSFCESETEGVGCCILEYSTSYEEIESNITLKMFKDIFGDTTRSQAMYPHFLHSLAESRVSSCSQQSAFMTQIAFDTKSLSSMQKIPSEDEAKNTSALKYAGRGAIHISGRNYYHWLQGKLTQNIIEMPELLAFPSLSFRSAAILWSNSYSAIQNGPLTGTSFNKLADGSRYGFLLLSYYLRGKIPNIEELLKIWGKVNKVLNCSCKEFDGPQCSFGKRQGRCKMADECIGLQYETPDQCMGPTDAVRCSIGYDVAPQIDVYLENRMIWSDPVRLRNVLNILERTMNNPGRRISWKTFSKNNASFPFEWNSKMRNIAVIVYESLDDKENHLYNSIHLNERPASIFIDIKQKNSVKIIDGHFNFVMNLKESELEKILIEKIHSGPWLVPVGKSSVFQLEKLESSLITIDISKAQASFPTILVEMHKGKIVLDGMQNINQLPLHPKLYCWKNQLSYVDLKPNDTYVKQRILVRYTSANHHTEHVINAIIINSKAVVVVRGMMESNSASISSHTGLPLRQRVQGATYSTILMTSFFTIIASCSMSIVFICAIMHSTKQSLKTVDRLSAVDEEADGISVVIRYESQGCEKADDCITNEYMSDEQTKKDGDIHEIDYTMIKFFLISKEIEAYKIVSVLIYSLSSVFKRLLVNSMMSLLLVEYTLRFSSNTVYEFLIIEIALGCRKMREKLRNVSQNRSKLFLLVILWGIPALLSSFPTMFRSTIGQNWKWNEINAPIEISCKGILFMAAMVLSIVRSIKRTFHKEKVAFWHKEVIPIMFNLNFTVIWFFDTFDIHLFKFYWFPISYAILNFLLAVLVCSSVYWQTKQSLLAIKKEKIRSNAENEAQ